MALSDCAKYPLVIPAENLSLRRVLDLAWAKHVGGIPRAAAEADSIGLIKALVMRGFGIGWLTAFDAISEIEAGDLAFIPLDHEKIELSTLSIVSASGRTLSVPASLMIQHLSEAMEDQGVPTV